MDKDISPRPNTSGVIGLQLGDEGKGIVIDLLTSELKKNKDIKKIYVVRFQGGNNAGHTVEDIAFHQIPSGITTKTAIGILDQGMVINPEDLVTEIKYVEKALGDISNRLFVSEKAILCSDIERAEEWLYQSLNMPHARAGTARGIGPSVAKRHNRTGLIIYDITKRNWKEIFSNHYENANKLFKANGIDLKTVLVPDFYETKRTNIASKREVGDLSTFLKRIELARKFLLSKNIITNTIALHQKAYENKNIGYIFEGAQAVGLHPYFGTYPDVTWTDTSFFGVASGTGYFRATDLGKRLGVIKMTYATHVGEKTMPTEILLPKEGWEEFATKGTDDQRWAVYVINEAREWGTTTKRRRNVCHLDLPMVAYDIHMGLANGIVGTHLDIALEEYPLKVCTEYRDRNGKKVMYMPDLMYINEVTAKYEVLPSYEGKAIQGETKYSNLPKNAKNLIAFIEDNLKTKLYAVKTGPKRHDYIEL